MKSIHILSLICFISLIQCRTENLSRQNNFTYNTHPPKATIMVIGAHPDDEGIFFGGTLPYYSQTLNVPVVFIAMTTNWLNRDGSQRANSIQRENEMREAAWRYGLTNEPIFAFFNQSNRFRPISETWQRWGDRSAGKINTETGMKKAVFYIAEQIRYFRPDVIITHGFTGEYGNPDHKASAFAALAAYDLAAGKTAVINDSESAPITIAPENIQGEPWQTKKLYTHYSEADTNAVSFLFHDFWEEKTINGRSPREVANYALKAHESQGVHYVSSLYDNRGRKEFNKHPSELWSLIRSEVGSDKILNYFSVTGAEGIRNFNKWSKGDFLQNLPDETIRPVQNSSINYIE